MDFDKLSEEFIKYMYMFNKHKRQKEINKSMQGGWFILDYIYNNENVSPSDISNIMGVTTARIAAALNTLESDGLITRKIDPKDRRRITIDITPLGIKKAEESYRCRQNAIKHMLEKLGEEDAKEYVRLTKKLSQIQLDD